MDEFEELLKEISRQSKISELKVRKLIEEKQDELSGLVSKEGAAYMVGRELGVSLIREGRRQLKINNLVSGLRSVDLTARVMRIFEPREWEKSGKKGMVANVILGDETGTVRISLWNEELEWLNKLSEGDAVKITGGFVKEDNRGQPEMRIGKGRMEVTEEEVEVPETFQPRESPDVFQRKRANIAELKEGSYAEVKASIIKVFERKSPLFNVCPECEGRVDEEKGIFTCQEHGQVKPKQRLVVSGVLDDGTGNIGAVFFGEAAEKIFGMKTEDILEFSKAADVSGIYGQCKNLGRDFVIAGRVKMNEFRERLEFVADKVEEVDVENELKRILA